MSSWDGKGPILAFLCTWAPYRCYMDLGRSKTTLPPWVHPIKVMCAGRVDPAMVLYAFEKGAEGVMVIGCGEDACRYGPGPEQTRKMAGPLQGLMHVLGLNPERFCALRVASHEKERLLADILAFTRRVARLGKSPLGK